MSTELTDSPKLMDKLGTIAVGNRGIQLTNIDDVFRFARAVHGSQLCPKGFSERDCFLVIANGLEVGMSPMAALQSTYIVNNRAAIFGDMPLALVRQSGLLESYSQQYVGREYEDNFKAIVTTKRRGVPDPIITEYSVADAKLAEVWGKKPSPWSTAPKRMLLFRARGFNLRDNFSDVLKGCSIAELDDGVGFENARNASGRVVEPNFSQEPGHIARLNFPPADQPQPPASEHSTDAPKRGRGRPPKPSAPENLFGPGSEDTTPPEPQPVPVHSPEALEILARLQAQNISLPDFLLVMEKCAFLAASRADILAGKIGIELVTADGLQRALEQWPDVLKMIPMIKKEG